MDTVLHIYLNLACMAMSCLSLPAVPLAVWALIRHDRKK